MPSIYLAPYHSQPHSDLRGCSGQFAAVEKAIVPNGWPYDNGDDPSFFAARHGGRLTWGICRQQVRNKIQRGDIVVFFAFTRNRPTRHQTRIDYRLSAVATVEDLLERRSMYTNARLRRQWPLYLNILISPVGNGKWRHNEDDRPDSARHDDWVWRVAEHGRNKKEFERRNKKIYETGAFRDRELVLAKNYILFSSDPAQTYITSNPPVVAHAVKERHESEEWHDRQLERLAVCKAARHLKSGRNYLRTANRSGRNVHPVLRFELAAGEAESWRNMLIKLLKARDRLPRHLTKRYDTHESRISC